MDIIQITQPFLYGSMMIAFLYAIINWRYIKNKPEKWLVLFLMVTVIIEIIANYYKRIELSNLLVFSNLVIIITNTILFLWFYEYLKNKLLLIISISLAAISFIINSYFQDFLYHIFYYANFAISIMLIVNVFAYFNKLLKTSDVLHYKKIPAFWISIGVIIYQLNLVLVFFLLRDLVTLNRNIYYTIITIVSVLLYGSIWYGIKLNKING
ncbi:hypothetical protein JCM19298_2078 [Nonlabens ulvanivorans]|nr:hypothetical protein [Nonlabens ulvanivorans]GAK93359.1 hypothetical protein JCM19298_2078 [Nonlabens ulvanivorans]